jgi:hypothetical protein
MRRGVPRADLGSDQGLPASAAGLRREDKAVGENDGDGGLREGVYNGKHQHLDDDLKLPHDDLLSAGKRCVCHAGR